MKRLRWRDFLENILIAIFLALIMRTFVLTGYKVSTSSMAPTLVPGDFIFSYKVPYGIKWPFLDSKILSSTPERGEVVSFKIPDQVGVIYVKRVIGLPGDRISITNNKVTVNDKEFTYEDLQQVTGLDSAGRGKNYEEELFQAQIESDGDSKYKILVKRDGNTSRPFGPIVVPPGHVFLMGDNRDATEDSRYWGAISMDNVEGRVLFIWLSLDMQKKWAGYRLPTLRTERIFHGVQ